MSELNNWLQYQEDEEFERFKAEKGNKRQTKAAMLAGLGLAASLGAVAVNANEAKAEEQGSEMHDLLLCTYDNGSSVLVGTGYIATNPKGSDDPLYPQSFDNVDPEKIPSYNSPLFWKGYIFRATYNYYTGASIYRVYKMVNGQEIETGQLPNIVGSDLFDIISSKSGIITGTDGKYYKFVDTGSTVNLEELGDIPQWGSLGTSYGGYIFNEHPDLNNQHKSYVLALNEDDILNSVPGLEVPLASEIELQTDGTNKESGGLDADEQTGELVVALQHGFVTAQLPTLDADGKLPADFSLTELTFGPKISLGQSTIKVLASGGYRYFKAGDGKSMIIVTPNSQQYKLTSAQLCGNASVMIMKTLKFETGGIYIIFDDDFNIPPISLAPTSDPTKFITPGVPFEKIVDEPTNVTQHIISNGCTAVPQEYHDMFTPAADPCAGVTCPPSAEQCKEAVCDSQTGDCNDINKTDGTTCTDANACTVGDACADGQCAPGAPKTCEEPVNPNSCMESGGCNPETGWCSTVKKPAGTPCDDVNPDTKDDKCNSQGQCEGTPIQVEPEPEEDPDVVEQEVEQEEEIIEGELVEEGEIEPDEDVVEQDDSSDAADTVDAAEIEQETDSAEPEAETDSEVETDSADQESDTEVDSSGEDLAGDDANGETSEDSNGENVEASEEAGSDTPVPQIDEETPGGTPDCSCKVANTQRQQRGVGEMLLVFGSAALAMAGLRRRKEKNQ